MYQLDICLAFNGRSCGDAFLSKHSNDFFRVFRERRKCNLENRIYINQKLES